MLTLAAHPASGRWRLSGPDASRFRIEAGALRFAARPDFERPGDADGDNRYEVTLQPGAGADAISLTVRVEDRDEPGRAVAEPRRPVVGEPVRVRLSDPDLGPDLGNAADPAVRWERWRSPGSWQAIPEAAGPIYTPTPGDAGRHLRAVVSYPDRHGPGRRAVAALAHAVLGPMLTALDARADSGRAEAEDAGLRPAFDPRIRHYGLPCAERDVMTVSFAAPPGVRVSVNSIQPRTDMTPSGSEGAAAAAVTPASDVAVTGHDAHGFGPGSGPGQAFGQDRFGGGGAQAYSMTAREALLGSSCTATGEKDGTGGSLAFWGRAAQSSFDGREGTFSLDGEATTAMLGADYARGNWLVGMALMQSSGEGGYRDTDPGENVCDRPDMADMDPETKKVVCNGAVRAGDGEVEATLTAAVPYAAIQASERMKLWGALGHGTGEVTLRPETPETETSRPLTSDISWTMAAMGLRGDVVAPQGSGPALAVTSDALWARTSSDKTHELAASDSDVTRLRLGLEGSWKVALEGNGSVTPKLEIGARHDGGDAETGFGVELGGGLAWVDPTLGLSLDLSGRTLVAHGNDDLEDRGFAASLAFDPDPATKRGPSLTLAQDWGGQAA